MVRIVTLDARDSVDEPGMEILENDILNFFCETRPSRSVEVYKGRNLDPHPPHRV
jgi:hypothetical protein